jgi:hypothetical protein
MLLFVQILATRVCPSEHLTKHSPSTSSLSVAHVIGVGIDAVIGVGIDAVIGVGIEVEIIAELIGMLGFVQIIPTRVCPFKHLTKHLPSTSSLPVSQVIIAGLAGVLGFVQILATRVCPSEHLTKHSPSILSSPVLHSGFDVT